MARGVVGPARWLKTPSSMIHLQNTLVKSPGVFTGVPDDWSTVPLELIEYERDGIKAVCMGDREKAMMAGGECAQRVNDLPKVQDLIDRIMGEATEIVRNMHRHLAAS